MCMGLHGGGDLIIVHANLCIGKLFPEPLQQLLGAGEGGVGGGFEAGVGIRIRSRGGPAAADRGVHRDV